MFIIPSSLLKLSSTLTLTSFLSRFCLKKLIALCDTPIKLNESIDDLEIELLSVVGTFAICIFLITYEVFLGGTYGEISNFSIIVSNTPFD